MQWSLKRRGNAAGQLEETTQRYFSSCPFCGKAHALRYDVGFDERTLFCQKCDRTWRIRYSLGTLWFLRTSDPPRTKTYTSSWIVKRVDRSLEGIRPYLLLETHDATIGKQHVAEQGIDVFVWTVEPLLDYFDRYDRFIKAHAYERIKVAFACARMLARPGNAPISEPGLSVKQVAAVTNLPELEASNCMERLLHEGSITFQIRAEQGLIGVEALIVGFLGEPRYQMNEYTAEKILTALFR